jgi:hypothetical protein
MPAESTKAATTIMPAMIAFLFKVAPPFTLSL